MATTRVTHSVQISGDAEGPIVVDALGHRFEVTYAMQSTERSERGEIVNATLLGKRLFLNGNQAQNAVELLMPIESSGRYASFDERYSGVIA